MKAQKETYNTIKLRDKNINFRKWKVKDRKKFTQLLNGNNLDVGKAQASLVYDCLENPDIALSIDEFRYVLTSIRAKSIGNNIDFTLTCSGCEEVYERTIGLDEIIKPNDVGYKDIKVGDITLTFGDVLNKDFYETKIKECQTEAEVYMTDFLYKIRSVSGNSSFTFDEIQEYFDNVDVETFDAILDLWDEQRFYIDDIVQVECLECGTKENYIFDEIPGFFPDSWFGR